MSLVNPLGNNKQYRETMLWTRIVLIEKHPLKNEPYHLWFRKKDGTKVPMVPYKPGGHTYLILWDEPYLGTR